MVQIQPFEPRFAEGAAALILSIQRKEFGFPITLDDQPDLKDIAGFYQQGSGNFWVALDDGEVVGTISLRDIGDRQAALRKMFVHEKYRGAPHAVAKRLLDTLTAWAEQKKVRRIFLGTTDKFRAAHRFYEKSGFTEITRDALPATFLFMAVDTKFYRRDLEPA